MDSPFAPPGMPAEPPYAPPPAPPYSDAAGATTPTSCWPVLPDGTASTTTTSAATMPHPADGSVVLGEPVLPASTARRNAVVAIGVVVLLILGAFLVGGRSDAKDPTAAGSSASDAPSGEQTGSVTPVEPIGDPGLGLDVIAIVGKIRPSVVKIAVDVSGGVEGTGEGVGTGVILTSDGEILTNAHVVANAVTVRVVLDGESEPIDAEVLGVDVGNDLALLQVDRTDLTAMTFADSDGVRVGQPVVAMGYALDLEGDVSVTSGIISALGRSMVTVDGALDGLLQTDAAISSGNSGGPLVDAAGEMIGINTAVARGDVNNAANNIGFSISTKEVQRVVDRLRSSGSGDQPAQGYLGIGLEDRHDGGRGAIVTEVEDDSPADDLGLRRGDVVTRVNGAEINGQAGLIAAIRDSAPGDEVTIEYSRDGEARSGTTELVSRPDGG